MLEIRTAQPSDCSSIIEFQIAMAIESEDLFLDPQIVKLGVEAVFKDPSKGHYWVALIDRVIVGCLLVVPEWSDWRSSTILWIHSVFVAPDARRNGIFSAMYTKLRLMVEQSHDFAGLRLYVDRANAIAQKTYESLGMSREHYYLYEWLR